MILTTDLPTLYVRHIDGVVTITLNRPALRNAIDLAMCRDLLSVFSDIRFDSEVRAVVLCGAGTAFCSGIDIKELAGKSAAWVSMRRNLGLDVYLAIERCPVPVIGAVNGAAIGGGAELAAACDFVIASKDAQFQWPEALYGAVGATQRLPHKVGRARALELLFTARSLNASEAHALGFANAVVAADGLEKAVEERTSAIRRCKPLAIKLIKEAVRLGLDCDRTTGVDIERSLIERGISGDPP